MVILELWPIAAAPRPPLNLDPHRGSSTYRRVLWTVLAINGAMFLIEIGASLPGQLHCKPTLDFFGDARKLRDQPDGRRNGLAISGRRSVN